MSRVVIVGSSASLLDKKLGNVIDTYPHVVRFNCYVTKGLEEHVGSKEKIWACNLGLTVHMGTVSKYLSQGHNRYMWYVGNNYEIEKRILRLKRTLRKQFSVESLNFDVAEYIGDIKNEFKEEKLCFKRNKIRCGDNEKYATTGLRAIFKCLERFGKAHICGFTSWQGDNVGVNNGHYYTIENVPTHMHTAFKSHPEREHDVETEAKIIKKLKHMNLLEEIE